MSCLKFFNNNLVDSAVITPSTENANFPASNLKDPRRTKVFRSTAASSNIVFDFGSAKDVDSFFIVGDLRTGLGVSTVTLELNSSNVWTSPAFSQVITLDSTFNMGVATFTLQNYRYARLVLTSGASFCELSKVFIGKHIDLGRGPSFNWSYQSDDLSKIQENRYGQKFVDTIIRQKKLNMSFNLLTKEQLSQVLEIIDTKSNTLPFFIELGDDNIINNHDRFSGMVYQSSNPSISNTSFSRYSLTLQLEEAT